MQQFFVEKKQIGREFITITGEDVRHIKNVLRMRPGEKVRVSDGEGSDYICVLTELTDDFVQADIVDRAKDTELKSRIYLFQAIPKGERMETVIQKSVELGAYEIVPVSMKYCVVKLDEKKSLSKQKRWQAISESAAKQSKRSIVPKVLQPMNLESAFEYAKERCRHILVPYENEEGMAAVGGLLKELRTDEDIAVFIGPEGGFAAEEIAMLGKGAHCISLGRRILRTDTAAIAAMSMLMLALEMKEEQGEAF